MENNLNDNVKSDIGMKILLVIAIIVGLLVSFLLAYKMFIYDKKDNKENKDNDVVNKNDATEEALKKIDEKTKEVNTLINNFNYDYLISRGMELKSEDITKETILNMVLSKDMVILKKDIPSLHQKKLLLIDDVMTTGATILRAIELIKPLMPKKIKILVLSKNDGKRR